MTATTLTELTLDRSEIVRPMPWEPLERDWAPLVQREWLLTNGLGGYASGTVSGAPTRRYHGLLIAALPAPFGRTLMLAGLGERVRTPDGREYRLGGEETPERLTLHGAQWLHGFRLEAGLPVWEYRLGDVQLERSILLLHQQNTVVVRYRVVDGAGPVALDIRPLIDFRPHEAPVDQPLEGTYQAEQAPDGIEITNGAPDSPPLRLRAAGGDGTPRFTDEPVTRAEVLYRVESARGYASLGRLWSPGILHLQLDQGTPAGIAASTEAWAAVPDPLDAELEDAELRRRRKLIDLAGVATGDVVLAELLLAADQFVVRPAARPRDTARAHGAGEEATSVIAGYHWFTDWGRDTMISLEGLALVSGRYREAAAILRTFAGYIRDGLIPNLFPEGDDDGLYHTADATLWFFHALDRYAAHTGSPALVEELMPRLRDVVQHHLAGTRFGIGVDPDDGLLRQGEEGYQLTWMDAKVDDWVVTPRRGKAVEINALWYNALRVMETWERDVMGDGARAADVADHASRARAAFNTRFWYDEGHYLYDVVDGETGDDAAFRPNQVFAIALPHPVLERNRWQPVMSKVRERLLTPVGLRSLAPGHPDYREKYFGDLRARDAAYHQGTVWGWLIGPFVEAWRRVDPETDPGAFLAGLIAHLDDAGVGTMSEVFDAEPPHTPRGCIAQAWSVAEVLRVLRGSHW